MKRIGELTISAQGEREIVMARAFDAPARLVFDALTKPELLRRWLLGPPGWTMVVCDVDLKVGGRYRFVLRNAKGKDMGWGGVYREIAPPGRLVHTEKFDEAWFPGEALITSVLAERGGRTTLTVTILHESLEGRDGVLKSNMESGVAASYDRLAEVLASVATQGG